MAASLAEEASMTKVATPDEEDSPQSPIKGESLLVKKRVSRFALDSSQNALASASPTMVPKPVDASSSDLILKAKQIEEKLSSMLKFKSKTVTSLNVEATSADKVKPSTSSSQSKSKEIPPNPRFFIYMLPDDITPINKDTIVTRFNFFKDLCWRCLICWQR